MLYDTRVAVDKMAGTDICWPYPANDICREDDIYQATRDTGLDSCLHDVFSCLDRPQKLAKVDAALIARLRNVYISLLVNCRKQSSVDVAAFNRLSKSLFLDASVHYLYATLCCTLLRSIVLKCGRQQEPHTFDQPLYCWRKLSNLLYEPSAVIPGQQMMEDTVSSQTPLLVSALYNGYKDDRTPFIQNMLSFVVGELASTLLNTTVYYQSSSGGLFSGGKKQAIVVKELDGSPSQDCFTLLNSALVYSNEQLCNVHAFSILKRLLLLNTSSKISAPSLAAKDTLDVIRKYCLRLLEQCERKPVLSARDTLLLEAVFAECLGVLGILCALNEQIAHSVFHTTRALCSSIRGDDRKQNLSLLALNFLLNYGNGDAFHLDSATTEVFKEAISSGLVNQCTGYEVMDFILRNHKKLNSMINLLEKFLPAVLKLAAWYPCSFVDEVLALLPLIVSTRTAAEVFHSLIDLPLTAAVLELNSVKESNLPESSPYKRCLDSLSDIKFQIIYDFFLRDESGRGDTVDFLLQFQSMMAPFREHARTTALAQVTPLYLRKFFELVIPVCTPEVASSLLTGMLERCLVLFSPPHSTPEIQRTFASGVLDLVASHPDVLVLNQAEVVDFLMLYQNYTNTGDFYTNLPFDMQYLENGAAISGKAVSRVDCLLRACCCPPQVWTLGEYSSYITSARSPPPSDVYVKYHECLESVAYEAALRACSEDTSQTSSNFLKVLLVLMGSLAKIATMHQELIPRVLLCLNKVVQQIKSLDNQSLPVPASVLMRRATELINVLKIPNVAVTALSGRDHASSRLTSQNHMLATFVIDRISTLAK